MAKKKATSYAPQLFEHVKITRDRRLRRQHALFIPRYLSDAADIGLYRERWQNA